MATAARAAGKNAAIRCEDRETPAERIGSRRPSGVGMAPLSTTHLLVRWLHLLAMAVALGGATLAWWVSRTADATTTLAVARPYEAAFWAALSVLAMTGVGNLGALSPAIPRAGWGAALVVKLTLVLAVLLGSAVRTATVWAAGRRADPPTAPLERGYALTAVALIVAAGLAEVLAHG
jgi:uncharacterized membrane protein